jgi:hypothetical protein
MGGQTRFKCIDQPLLRDRVETFGASAVVAKPYVMTTQSLWVFRMCRQVMFTDNLDRVVPSH